MIKHYVTFYSPGTLFSETTTEEIESWNTCLAVKMAANIKERHGAKPYGFKFTTKERGEKDFDSRQTKESNMYYLGGKIRTLKEIEVKNDPAEETLLWNMKNNGYDRVIENNNSYRITLPLKKDDVVL